MGSVTTPALIGAVAGEGALGMIAAARLTAEQVAAQFRTAQELAGGDARIGVNFLVPFLDDKVLDAASQLAVLVECFYGDPDPRIVARVHRGGALAAWQVGSVDEARVAADAGCDVIIMQGVEAGGHVRGTTALLPLLAQTRDAIDLPLVAAGGIGSGAAMAEAMLAGADAVRVGTRFVATSEADAHPAYRDALIAAGQHDTVVTEAFSMGWARAPHRVLRPCVTASTLEAGMRSPEPPTGAFDGNVAAAALYAGLSVGDVNAVLPAGSVVRELVHGANAVLHRGAVDHSERGP